MKRHIAIQIRKTSWVVAVLFLIAFCWLGLAAASIGTLIKGLETYFPLTTRLATAWGPIAFPIFGIVAAIAVLLSDLWGSNRWVQLALIVFFAFLFCWAFTRLQTSGIFPGPAVHPTP